jgi:hypothetical protein
VLYPLGLRKRSGANSVDGKDCNVASNWEFLPQQEKERKAYVQTKHVLSARNDVTSEVELFHYIRPENCK